MRSLAGSCAGRASRSCLPHGDAFELVLESPEPLTRQVVGLELAGGDVNNDLFLETLRTLAMAPQVLCAAGGYGDSEKGGLRSVTSRNA